MDVRSLAITNSAKDQLLKYKDIDSPFFIIGVSGSLHIVKLCIRFIPSQTKIILISNGLADWENEWCLCNLRLSGFIRFSNRIGHGQVLDFLFKELDKPFGILDYDCFVLNPIIFEEIKLINPETFINAIFMYHNKMLGLEIPETFFLYFNTQILKMIKQKFHVSCMPFHFNGLSKKVKRRLNTIGIDKDHFPEDYKNYFDTLKLLISLGLAEGYKIDFIRKYPTLSQPNMEIFHIGGVSTPLATKGLWNFRGSYFWWRCLEECRDPILQENYKKTHDKITSQELLEKHPTYSSYQSFKRFFDFVENNIF